MSWWVDSLVHFGIDNIMQILITIIHYVNAHNIRWFNCLTIKEYNFDILEEVDAVNEVNANVDYMELECPLLPSVVYQVDDCIS